MSIITVRHHSKNVEVEILDVYPMGSQLMATVEAVQGKPFVGGDKWPVHTPYATVRFSELECNCFLPEQSCPICAARAAQAYGETIPYSEATL